MTFDELIHYVPFQLVMIWLLLCVVLVAGGIVWYYAVTKKRESEYNEQQKKHRVFQRTYMLIVIAGAFPLPRFIYSLLAVESLLTNIGIIIGYYAFFTALMLVAGRLIYGEEGSINPKKTKPIHES